MKSNTVRRTVIGISRILFLFIACEIAAWGLNRQVSGTWKMLLYDLRSGFVDHRDYLKKFLLFFVVFAVVYIFYIVCNKDGLSFEWHVRIGKGKRRLFIWKSYWVILICTCAMFLGLTWMVCSGMASAGRYNLWQGSTEIGHSFGRVGKSIYTGSLEAFLENYERGYRTFEVDLEITSDNHVVLRHDWDQAIQEGISSDNIPTQERFLSIPIKGKLTPLSFRDLCLLMQEYPDIWIVTDSKYADWDNVVKQFTIMVQTAKECGAEEILDRLVIQIYNPAMYDAVTEVYSFRSYIFTMYQYWDGSPEQFTQICRWSVDHDVDVITMPRDRATQDILEIAERYDSDVYVHTVNEVEAAKDFLDKGVRGIYTDNINPEDLKEDRE